MFNKFIRYYNQNRRKILRIVIILVAIFILIRLANYLAKTSNNKPFIFKTTDGETKELQTESIINNKKINIETAKINNNIINKFVEYCNEKKIEDAYQLLSTDCKENVFNTLEEFINNYYNTIFSSKKIYSKDNLIISEKSTTYCICYTNNILENGGYLEGESFVDYITVIKENNEAKLNINKFIKKEEINKQYEDKEIKIKIISKLIYNDFEEYKIEITNKTEFEINVYDKTPEALWYLTDKNNTKCYAKLEELTNNDFILNKNISKIIDVKFIKTYNPNNNAVKINFDKVFVNNNNKKLTIKI